MPLFLTFIIFNIQLYKCNHTFIHRSPFVEAHHFVAEQEDPSWGAKPRLNPGLPYRKPHPKLSRTLSYAALYTTPHPKATSHPWATPLRWSCFLYDCSCLFMGSYNTCNHQGLFACIHLHCCFLTCMYCYTYSIYIAEMDGWSMVQNFCCTT